MVHKILRMIFCVTFITIIAHILLYSWNYGGSSINRKIDGDTQALEMKAERDQLLPDSNNMKQNYSRLEDPSIYLHSHRFDVFVKIVYAYFYMFSKDIPQCIKLSYTEHLRVWNNYREYCEDLDPRMIDYKRKTCKPKRTKEDFLLSFHQTLTSIKNNKFDDSKSNIPLDKNGFLINGAHRLSASIVLSSLVSFQHLKYTNTHEWNYEFFLQKGLKSDLVETVMLEYMKIQVQLNLSSQVSIMILFDRRNEHEKAMQSIFKSYCSRDGGALYQKAASLTRLGLKQLIAHMYGFHSWFDSKVSDMNYLFAKFNSTEVSFLFFFGHNIHALKKCKNKIRGLYNRRSFKSSVHIPDTPEENMILAEMILNNNSVFYLNNGKNSHVCKDIANEIARRLHLPKIKSLPFIYIGREDVMIDSGSILRMFGIRDSKDFDVLFLNQVDKLVPGNHKGILIEAHTFASYNPYKVRPFDLFFDPKNYGYCYGLKFLSLEKLLQYKITRNAPGKDFHDVELIRSFLGRIWPERQVSS